MEYKEIIVSNNDDINKRLDIFLAEKLDLTRNRIQSLIEENNIKVNNLSTKSSYKVKLNDNISIFIPPLKELSVEPQNIPLNIVYEDEHIIVINKPKNFVVHPANGNEDNTLVNALLYHCKNLSGIGGTIRPGIVHRLDKDTTGLIVVAKSDIAHQSLSEQIKNKIAKRYYKAFVIGNVKDDTGVINKPIGRNPIDRKKMCVLENGKEAITYWKVLERFSNKYTLLELELKTGRTHQIRVHLSYIKHGILGDEVYGPNVKLPVKLNGQALHAYKLVLYHPLTNKLMEFKAEEAIELVKLQNYLRNL
ncbi:MAG: pseudouridine synthase [Candidatus Sericytochromatia bacterium]|nr:MAG: pseudouridine synthase [Candidatus Sericytochromatia bacterium]